LITSQENLRLQKIITAVAIVLFILKMLAWYLTNSVAILTDALESTVNVVAGLIGVYSLYISAKPKDEDHPYGHGKVEFISAAVEGTLITVAGILIIYEAVIHLLHPSAVQKLDYGILLVGTTAVINFIAGAIAVKTGKKNNSLALIAAGEHLKSDTWTTLGLIVGLGLLFLTKLRWLDSAVAIVFSVYIMYTGYTIVRRSVEGIMDKADLEILDKMVTLLNDNRRENWIDLHNLRIIKYGGGLHMDCHVTVPWYLTVREGHDEIESLSKLVKDHFGESMELFVHSDPCLEFSCRICLKKDCLVRQHSFEKRVTWRIDNIIKDSKHRVIS
jgi:cation diffusion facilitator family transporter